jgi:hypothetical protein
LGAFWFLLPQQMVQSTTTNDFGSTTMLEKRFQNHYHNQTKPKTQTLGKLATQKPYINNENKTNR